MTADWLIAVFNSLKSAESLRLKKKISKILCDLNSEKFCDERKNIPKYKLKLSKTSLTQSKYVFYLILSLALPQINV